MQRFVQHAALHGKEAATNALQKAEAAANKAAQANAQVAAVEDVEWSKGAKSNAKK
jgi:hypothetical protein